jgi:mono/diheme cytochrome c family protein
MLMLAACSSGAYPADIFSEMHYQPNHRPLSPDRRYTAAGAVPVDGGRVPRSWSEAADLARPSSISSEGKQVFADNCVACHGQTGRGDGPVASYFRDSAAAPLPPTDLTSSPVRGRSDGQLYWIVANGLGNMPAFGDELTHDQLWAVVSAVRDLQASQP